MWACASWTTALAAAEPVILVMGDSLSAAYGIPADRGWVALLQARLQKNGSRARVVNASVSGETSSGGLARLPALLQKHQPRWVLIELGANDGLRGQPVKAMQANLGQMIELARAANARPVLFEMRIPSNYGPVYTEQFAASFGFVVESTQTPLLPFLWAPIALDASAFLHDGIHPGARAQPLLLDAVWPTLAPLLRE